MTNFEYLKSLTLEEYIEDLVDHRLIKTYGSIGNENISKEERIASMVKTLIEFYGVPRHSNAEAHFDKIKEMTVEEFAIERVGCMMTSCTSKESIVMVWIGDFRGVTFSEQEANELEIEWLNTDIEGGDTVAEKEDN